MKKKYTHRGALIFNKPKMALIKHVCSSDAKLQRLSEKSTEFI